MYGSQYVEIIMTVIILLFSTITNTINQTEKIYKDNNITLNDDCGISYIVR